MSNRRVRHGRRWCAWLGALVLILAGPVSPAVAEPDPEASSEAGPDTEALAREKGISIEEAVRRYGWHTAFSHAATAIEEDMPAAYAEAEVTGPYSASVTFAGRIPKGAAAYFKALPDHVEVKLIGGAPYPRAELVADMQELHLKVHQDPEVDQVVGWVDAKRGVIELVVRPRDKDKGAQSKLRARLTAFATEASRIPVELTFTDASLGDLHTGQDGGWSLFSVRTPRPRFLIFHLPFASTH